jgi:hypothetical protein
MADKDIARQRELGGMSDPHAMLDFEMSRRGTSPVLVGRATEMAALKAAFETVRQGGPAAALVGGEAGVGKTRLIGEFGAAARTAGARVLAGGCLELGADGLPFGPFTAMLRDLVRAIGRSTAPLARREAPGAPAGPGRRQARRPRARLAPGSSRSSLPCSSGSPSSGRWYW